VHRVADGAQEDDEVALGRDVGWQGMLSWERVVSGVGMGVALTEWGLELGMGCAIPIPHAYSANATPIATPVRTPCEAKYIRTP
jgi:hypothetical protein